VTLAYLDEVLRTEAAAQAPQGRAALRASPPYRDLGGRGATHTLVLRRRRRAMSADAPGDGRLAVRPSGIRGPRWRWRRDAGLAGRPHAARSKRRQVCWRGLAARDTVRAGEFRQCRCGPRSSRDWDALRQRILSSVAPAWLHQSDRHLSEQHPWHERGTLDAAYVISKHATSPNIGGLQGQANEHAMIRLINDESVGVVFSRPPRRRRRSYVSTSGRKRGGHSASPRARGCRPDGPVMSMIAGEVCDRDMFRLSASGRLGRVDGLGQETIRRTIRGARVPKGPPRGRPLCYSSIRRSSCATLRP